MVFELARVVDRVKGIKVEVWLLCHGLLVLTSGHFVFDSMPTH